MRKEEWNRIFHHSKLLHYQIMSSLWSEELLVHSFLVIKQELYMHILHKYRCSRPPGDLWASSVPRKAVFCVHRDNEQLWALTIFRKPETFLSNLTLDLSVPVSHFLSLPLSRGGTERYLYRGFTQYSTRQAFMPSEDSHNVKSLLSQYFPKKTPSMSDRKMPSHTFWESDKK